MAEQILDDVFQEDQSLALVSANKGKRLANYLLDYLFAFIGILLIYLVLIFTGTLDLETMSRDNPFLDNLIGIVAYFAYYAFSESALQGKTLAKYITRTRVVREDGSRPELSQILGRSAARLIPFEVFSFLGSGPGGWHDSLSKTLVIDEKLSTLPATSTDFV